MTVERPLRLKGVDPDRAYAPKEIKALKETADARTMRRRSSEKSTSQALPPIR